MFCEAYPGAESRMSSADILLSRLQPSVKDAKSSVIDTDNLTHRSESESEPNNELADEWNDALSQRYGSSLPPSQKTHEKSRKKKNQSHDEKPELSRKTDSVANPNKPDPAEVSHRQSESNVHFEEPEQCFIDPSNNRAIAVFPSGRRIAMGALTHHVFCFDVFTVAIFDCTICTGTSDYKALNHANHDESRINEETLSIE